MGTKFTVDDLAQEIRRVDGGHTLGAGALAEALMPFIEQRSAAPDMLEALKTARSHLVLLGGDNRGIDGADEIQGAVLDVVDAAIAKATGATP